MGSAQGTRPTPVTSEGHSTLNNYSTTGPTWDNYCRTGTPSTTNETVDLLRVVVPFTGVAYDIDVTVWTSTGADFLTQTSYRGLLTVYPTPPPWPEIGDTDVDGDVDPDDLSNFAKGWYGTSPPTWATGDFDGDYDVDADDLSLFADGWYGLHGTGGGHGCRG